MLGLSVNNKDNNNNNNNNNGIHPVQKSGRADEFVNTSVIILTHWEQGCTFQVFPMNIRGVPLETCHNADESFLG
jgi:hypothetical protein